MSYPTIGIFPAAGGLGGATLHTLLQICDPKQVVLISRHPEKLAKAAERGASTRKADFDDDASLEHAFEGVDVLNLISYPSFVVEHRVKVHKRAIDAARKQGVKTVRRALYPAVPWSHCCLVDHLLVPSFCGRLQHGFESLSHASPFANRGLPKITARTRSFFQLLDH